MRIALAHFVTWVIGFALLVIGAGSVQRLGWGGVLITVLGVAVCISHDIARSKS